MALVELGSPELLLLTPLFVTLTLLGHYFAQRLKTSLEVFHFPPVKRLSRIMLRKGVRRSKWRGMSLALKLALVVLITLSLAHPTLLSFSEVSQKVEVPMVMDKDIAGQVVLAIDASPSMKLQDVQPTRFEVAKETIIEFVENASDKVRFGIVSFEGRIRQMLPITDNRTRVLSMIANLTPAEALPCLEEFTDIGFAIQTSLDLLTPYSSSTEASAIILVSDGFANYGYPDPFGSVFHAMERARDLGVPVHALHVARMGQDSNDELMRQIAIGTLGKFMESSNAEELRNILSLIAKYYVPTHEWSSVVEIKTTIPSRTELTFLLLLVASGFLIMLWIGNYRHYKTSF